jgi:hypothetical protein
VTETSREYIFEGCKPAHQIELLEYECNSPPVPSDLPSDVGTVKVQGAAVRLEQSSDAAKECSLAGSAWPEHRHEFMLIHRETDISYRDVPLETFRQFADDQSRARRLAGRLLQRRAKHRRHA